MTRKLHEITTLPLPSGCDKVGKLSCRLCSHSAVVLAMSGPSYLCRSKMPPGYVPFCSVVQVQSAERVLQLGALAHREWPPLYLPDEENDESQYEQNSDDV